MRSGVFSRPRPRMSAARDTRGCSIPTGRRRAPRCPRGRSAIPARSELLPCCSGQRSRSSLCDHSQSVHDAVRGIHDESPRLHRQSLLGSVAVRGARGRSGEVSPVAAEPGSLRHTASRRALEVDRGVGGVLMEPRGAPHVHALVDARGSALPGARGDHRSGYAPILTVQFRPGDRPARTGARYAQGHLRREPGGSPVAH